jgi:PAS domain S-box-containing protein
MGITNHNEAPQRLTPAEDRLRLIVDTTPALIHSARPDGYLDYFNQRWLEYLGLSLGDVEGWKWTGPIHPDDVAGTLDRWRACIATGEVFEYETRVRRADGEYRWMLHRKVPLYDDQGNIIKWYGASIDIENRKRAEDALQQSEFYLAEGQRLAHMGSWAFNPAGFFNHWSSELFQIFGLDVASAAPTLEEYLDLIHPQDREFVKTNIQTMLAEHSGCDFLNRIVRPDGQIRHVRCVGVPLIERGGFQGFVGTAIDVTEQEHLTQELGRREAYLEEAQRLSHTGSFGWNVASGEIYWSDETFRIFEYDRAVKPTLEIVLQRVHPDDQTFVQETIKRVSNKGENFDIEHRLKMPDGRVKYLHILARALGDSTGELEFVGAVTDVTAAREAEEALRRSKEYLAEAQRLTHTGSWVYDPAIRKTPYWSEEVFRIFGMDPQDGVPLYDETKALIHPDDRDRVSETCLKGIGEKVEFKTDFRVVLRDGTLKHLQAIWHPVLNETGELVHYVGTVMDITERKRVNEALLESEEQWRDVFENNPTMYFIVDTDGVVMSVNPHGAEQLGYTVEELIGRSVLGVFYGPDREAVQENIALCLLQIGRSMSWELRKVRKDGSVLWGRETARAVLRKDGPIILIACEDITDRKIAEERIRQDERELRQLIDSLPQLVIVLDADGRLLHANQMLLDYTGHTLKELRAMGAEELVERNSHPDDLERVQSQRRRGLSSGAPFEIERRLLRKDGQYRWFLFRFNPLFDEWGRIVRWFGTATYIEQWKQEEEGLRKENIALREEIVKTSMLEEIVGTSPALQAVLVSAAKVAPTDSTVLIAGETGTGKELIARAIHKRSNRSMRAFVSVNCAAIPLSLIASELFGHEKGAFTGALLRRLGRFELAEGGTIFLDEIGELPAETQVTLLRVLQEHEFERVGGSQSIRADVRVIAATNRDLQAAIAAGTFRRDLFYRLNVFPIEMPPLRERREDIPLLVRYFLDRYSRRAGKNIQGVTKESLGLLQAYSWPGNIRELQNVIERSVIVCETEEFTIDENWLSRQRPAIEADNSHGLSEKLATQEKEAIEAALRASGGRVYGPSGAAAKLGMPRSTLESKIRSLKINKNRFKPHGPKATDSS